MTRLSDEGINPARRGAWMRLPLKALATVAVILALACLSGWLDGHDSVIPEALFGGGLAPWANALPAILLMLVVLAVTRRLLLSMWLALAVQALLYGISAVKLANLASVLRCASAAGICTHFTQRCAS